MSKLKDLLDVEGFEDAYDFLEAYASESVVPGICMNPGCTATYEYEPDSRRGWCDACQTNTVASGLVLLGVI